MGNWLTSLTVPYVLFQITHSAVWVGLYAAMQFLPQVALSPLGGALADRHDRRSILLLTQTGIAAATLGLWAMYAGGVRQPWAIAGVIALTGCLSGLTLPSWAAFVNDLVPLSDLASAITLNSLQFNAARAIGPALAGTIIAAWGPSWAFLFNVAAFGFVVGALVLAGRVAPQTPRATMPALGVLRDFQQALRYVGTQPGIRVAIWMSVLIGLLGNPAFGFTVVFAESVFNVGPIELGLMNAAGGLGALAAAPLAAGLFRAVTPSRAIKWGLIACGLAEISFGIAPTPAASYVALFVVGGTFLIVISVANIAVQTIVASAMRGRVLAVRIMLVSASFPAGAVTLGWISDQVGPRPTMIGTGLTALVLGTWTALRKGGEWVRRIEDAHDGTS